MARTASANPGHFRLVQFAEMTNPLVCCVMVTRDRPQMSARAIECFDRQTYPSRQLLILNTGGKDDFPGPVSPRVGVVNAEPGATIGALRNQAIALTERLGINPQIIATWDDDDWSHPRRIEEQVANLKSSDAEIVGYSDMLFYREPEAWLYHSPERNIPVGTSLCFWRYAWERRPFPGTSKGEDFRFVAGRRHLGVSSLAGAEPRMVATVHGANTMAAAYGRIPRTREYRRTPEWDGYCERALVAPYFMESSLK